MRRDEGLEITDRIVLTVPQDLSELVDRHGDWIKEEVLARRIAFDGGVGIEKVDSGA